MKIRAVAIWSEGDISTAKLLKALPHQPAFGDKQGKKRWLFFIKGMKGEQYGCI